MATLVAADYRAMLEFLRGAGEIRGRHAFPQAVLEQLRDLIPCECVSYGEFAGKAVRRKQIRSAPGRVTPDDIGHALDRLRDQHPLLAGPLAVGRALRQSDLMTRREIRSNPVCQLGRLVGIHHAMDLWIADRGRVVGGFGFDAASRDFRDATNSYWRHWCRTSSTSTDGEELVVVRGTTARSTYSLRGSARCCA